MAQHTHYGSRCDWTNPNFIDDATCKDFRLHVSCEPAAEGSSYVCQHEDPPATTEEAPKKKKGWLD